MNYDLIFHKLPIQDAGATEVDYMSSVLMPENIR